MSTELIGLIFEKLNVSNATKVGLVMSYVVFKGFDIEGLAKRHIWPEKA